MKPHAYLFRSDVPAEEAELGEDAVDDEIAKVINADIKAQVLNMNWKERLAGVQSMLQVSMLFLSALQ